MEIQLVRTTLIPRRKTMRIGNASRIVQDFWISRMHPSEGLLNFAPV